MHTSAMCPNIEWWTSLPPFDLRPLLQNIDVPHVGERTATTPAARLLQDASLDQRRDRLRGRRLRRLQEAGRPRDVEDGVGWKPLQERDGGHGGSRPTQQLLAVALHELVELLGRHRGLLGARFNPFEKEAGPSFPVARSPNLAQPVVVLP